MKATLVYYRYHVRYEAEFASLGEAVGFAAAMADSGEGHAEEIRTPKKTYDTVALYHLIDLRRARQEDTSHG